MGVLGLAIGRRRRRPGPPAGQRLEAEGGAFALSGPVADLRVGYRLEAEGAAFVLSGLDADLQAPAVYAPAWVSNGGAAALAYEGALAADSPYFEACYHLRGLEATSGAGNPRLREVAGRSRIFVQSDGDFQGVLTSTANTTLVDWNSANNHMAVEGEYLIWMRAALVAPTPTFEVWRLRVDAESPAWAQVAGGYSTAPIAGTIHHSRTTSGYDNAFLSNVGGTLFMNCEFAAMWESFGATPAGRDAFWDGEAVLDPRLTAVTPTVLLMAPEAAITDNQGSGGDWVRIGAGFTDVIPPVVEMLSDAVEPRWFVEGTGVQSVDAAPVFSGLATSFVLVGAPPAGVTISAGTGVVSVDTAAAYDWAEVVVRGTGPAGVIGDAALELRVIAPDHVIDLAAGEGPASVTPASGDVVAVRGGISRQVWDLSDWDGVEVFAWPGESVAVDVSGLVGAAAVQAGAAVGLALYGLQIGGTREIISSVDWGVAAAGAVGLRVQSCRISGFRRGGVSVTGGSDPALRWNAVWHCGLENVARTLTGGWGAGLFVGGADGAELSHNWAFENFAPGIIAEACGILGVGRNILYDNYSANAVLDGAQGATVEGNVCWASNPAYFRGGAPAQSIVGQDAARPSWGVSVSGTRMLEGNAAPYHDGDVAPYVDPGYVDEGYIAAIVYDAPALFTAPFDGWDPAPLAFAGAQGWGAATQAGRGGQILHVTTLADSGAGSLRAALTTIGPRMIVFDVGGEITLSSEIATKAGVSILGAGAPWPGITIARSRLWLNADDVLLRDVRLRAGDEAGGQSLGERDSVSIGDPVQTVRRIIVDHCSMSWAVDENTAIWGAAVEDVTWSANIIAESFNNAGHPQTYHGMGLLLGPGSARVSVHGNLFSGNNWRNPQLAGSDGAEVVNNLITCYGPDALTTYGAVTYSHANRADFIGNVFEAGPGTPNPTTRAPIGLTEVGGNAYYVHDNLTPMGPDAVRGTDTGAIVGARVAAGSGLRVLSSALVRAAVLADAGARRPFLDPVDARILTKSDAKTLAVGQNSATLGLDYWRPSSQAGLSAVTVQAETLTLVSGFAVASNVNASGGQLIAVTGAGVARYVWAGAAGLFDLAISYFDENDGQASCEVVVGGRRVDGWVWDEPSGSAFADPVSRRTRVIPDVALWVGAVVELRAVGVSVEPARVDFLAFTPAAA